MSDPELEMFDRALVKTLAQDNDRLRAERDELLAALKAIVWEATPDNRERAAAAIAKSGGRS